MKKAELRTGWQIAVHNPAYRCRPATWLFWLIRWATRSHWNHWAGIWVRPTDGEVFVVEMRGGLNVKQARRITRWEIWLHRSPDRKFEVLPCPLQAITREDLDAWAGGYDYLSIGLRQPLYLATGWWVGGKNDRARTCSEYWARVHLLPDAHRAAPRDLARIFQASRP